MRVQIMVFGSKLATVVLGAVVVAAGTAIAVVGLNSAKSTSGIPTSVGPPAVVGFGDSVAAGYGLSADARWPMSLLSSRFPNGDARCPSTTPQAYPCVLAGLLNDDVEASRNYAVQGADSAAVLIQLSRAETDMTPVERAAVNVVTLTVGADDISFSGCLSAEIKFVTDPCLAGNINNLSLSQTTAGQLGKLKQNLPSVLSRITQLFPHSRVLVTGYYDPFPSDVPAGSSACRFYFYPAIAAFVNNIGGLGAGALIVAFNDYARDLPQTEILFQTRFHRVANFLDTQLNSTIAQTVSGAAPAAILVSLGPAFTGHDMCSLTPWVYSVNSSGGIKGFGAVVPLGATCNFPMPYNNPQTGEVQKTYSLGPLGSVTIESNCVPHPTTTGQMNIASILLAAFRAPPVVPSPAQSTSSPTSQAPSSTASVDFTAAADALCQATSAKIPEASNALDLASIVQTVRATLSAYPSFLQQLSTLVAAQPNAAALRTNYVSPITTDWTASVGLARQLIAAYDAGDTATAANLVDQIASAPDHRDQVEAYLGNIGLTDCAALEAK